ncbi:hypothetical protein Gotri_005921, partial [Gossypium trilobum]|nr:hypothetical protein [Gossypium trilobum]
ACEVCVHGSEDVLYVLRDCPAARNIWNKLILANKLSNFYSISLYEWMIDNLLNQAISWNTDEIIKVSHIWAKQIEDGFTAAGGFVCDHNVGWIFSFIRYLGICTVIDVELKCTLDGLKLIL